MATSSIAGGFSGPSIVEMPVEIRLQIYSALFGNFKVVLDAGNPSGTPCLIPDNAVATQQPQRSSQLLRVSKQILDEARPILYANTTFLVVIHTFAGSLPRTLGSGHPIAGRARNVIWQLNCDLLKRFYDDDFAFKQGELNMLDSLEIQVKADTWKGSFCGEDCDREGFVRGRNGTLGYGKLLLAQMHKDGRESVKLVEDQRFLGKGEVRFRLRGGKESLSPADIVVE